MNPKIIEFDGKKYRLNGNYYRHDGWSKKGASNLHRAIWEFYNGKIPDGMEVHHIDGNTFNNDILNLECINASEHRRQHALQNIKAGILKPPSKEALIKAAEWHASEQGIAWHKENGKEIWKDRKWHECSCIECGNKFMSPFPTRAKFCHQNCKATNRKKRLGIYIGTRPNRKKEIILTGKRATN